MEAWLDSTRQGTSSSRLKARMGMMQTYDIPNQNKISSEFAARLTHLEHQQKIRVIVLLQIQDDEEPIEKRPSRIERQAKINEVRARADKALGYIDSIIQYFDGKPLVQRPYLLGAIPIEITVEGVKALAQSGIVRAVIEDQAIYS
jgi:hypothetical protein